MIQKPLYFTRMNSFLRAFVPSCLRVKRSGAWRRPALSPNTGNGSAPGTPGIGIPFQKMCSSPGPFGIFYRRKTLHERFFGPAFLFSHEGTKARRGDKKMGVL